MQDITASIYQTPRVSFPVSRSRFGLKHWLARIANNMRVKKRNGSG